MVCAIEDAGFEIRDLITHHFGSGFPKSLDVSKAIDAAAGANRDPIGMSARHGGGTNHVYGEGMGDGKVPMLTAPSTDAATQWAGWGTALKPGTEHWILARKPLTGTVAANVQEHGTGALNIDGCRIEAKGRPAIVAPGTGRGGRTSFDVGSGYHDGVTDLGRWPANVAFTHSFICTDDTCAEDCPVRELDEQSGETTSGGYPPGGDERSHGTAYGKPSVRGEPRFGSSSGGASRFFYCAKPATSEREAGLDHLPRRNAAELTASKEGQARLASPRTGAGRTSKGRANHHPTVKSLGLMTWLTKLITPPRGLVIDPFAGSGTGGVAACRHRFRWIGWEIDPDFHALATERLQRAVGKLELCA
jgi:site-specific DNA-methyltransferase (adenine-specific)